MQELHVGERYHCLDMLRVAWQSESKPSADCAILLEIWDSGGLLQTNVAIPENAVVAITSAGEVVNAHVTSCEQDDYGFLIQIEVNAAQEWFPAKYVPPYLLSANSTS